MNRAIFCTNMPKHIKSAYDADAKAEMRTIYEIEDKVWNKNDIVANADANKDVEAIFTTWGMPHFTSDEVKKYFPSLKYVYYGAGSVQDFAREFLENGVRIFSAASANAIPVAEYTTAMILLANKMTPFAIKNTKKMFYQTQITCLSCPGNYKTKIGIVGAGKIGSTAIKNLQTLGVKAEFYAYDPYLSEERAKALGVKRVSLLDLFKTCDIISNHLANKEELTGLLGYHLFKEMKPKATFINTGRGRQVSERGLVKAMRECKTRSAILDVTFPEPAKPFGPLRTTKNIYLTPHIAGSLGGEIARMGDYMVADAKTVLAGGTTSNEVTLEMLKFLA